MSIIKNYLRVGLRTILRSKVYSIINITGLAIGLASCMILSIWIHYHLSFDQFHENADRIVRPILDVDLNGIDVKFLATTTEKMAHGIASVLPEVENFVHLYRRQQTAKVRNGNKVQYYWEYYYSDSSFFDIFSFELEYGDPKTALQNPKSLVLTAEAADALFDEENPVDRFVQVGSEGNFKITGVLKKIPNNSHFQFQVLCSYDEGWLKKQAAEHPYDPQFYAYFLLHPDADLNAMQAKMPAFFKENVPEIAHGVTVWFQPLLDIHLYSAGIENDRSWRSIDIRYIYIFAAIALIVLFIACINYINLATAHARRRAKEVGIRKATGATRLQLMFQFLGESVMIAFFAMLLGYLFIEMALPAFNQLFDNELSITQFGRLNLLGVMSILALVVGLNTGLYPAFVLSTPMPRAALNLMKTNGRPKFTLRRVLVVAQFAMTMLLIVLSFTINEQLRWMQNKKLGFNKEHVINFKMPAGVQRNFEAIQSELLQYAWISGVSGMGPNSFPGFHGKRIDFEGQVGDEWWSVPCSAVDYSFVDFYGLEIVEGRDFSRGMATDNSQGYIINETMKKKLGWETAVGKRLRIQEYKDQPGHVIGVINDFNSESLHKNIEAMALFLAPDVLDYICVRTMPNRIPELLETMRDIWQRYAPDAAFERFFLDDVYARLYFSEQKTRRIVTAFSVLAIFIASIGLLGLVAYSTEQRTKEIGIRKVLGASESSVLVMLLREFFILLNVAVLVAWPLAWFFARAWLENFAYRSPLGLDIFLLAWVVTLLIAFLTVAGNVYKAAHANPIEALRYE